MAGCWPCKHLVLVTNLPDVGRIGLIAVWSRFFDTYHATKVLDCRNKQSELSARTRRVPCIMAFMPALHYINGFYNPRSVHLALGGKSPLAI
jgi:hypothetical protein